MSSHFLKVNGFGFVCIIGRLRLSSSPKGKLSPHYFGPYQILQKIGLVAYRLQLPVRAKIHDVFHVSLLKPFIGQFPQSPPPLPTLLHGRVCPLPAKALKSRRARDRLQVLVQWENAPETSAAWEDLEQFKK